jgi:hypothetical protein
MTSQAELSANLADKNIVAMDTFMNSTNDQYSAYW